MEILKVDEHYQWGEPHSKESLTVWFGRGEPHKHLTESAFELFERVVNVTTKDVEPEHAPYSSVSRDGSITIFIKDIKNIVAIRAHADGTLYFDLANANADGSMTLSVTGLSSVTCNPKYFELYGKLRRAIESQAVDAMLVDDDDREWVMCQDWEKQDHDLGAIGHRLRAYSRARQAMIDDMLTIGKVGGTSYGAIWVLWQAWTD